jgi:hypothetical protein
MTTKTAAEESTDAEAGEKPEKTEKQERKREPRLRLPAGASRRLVAET